MHYAVVNVSESLEGNADIISVTDGYVLFHGVGVEEKCSAA